MAIGGRKKLNNEDKRDQKVSIFLNKNEITKLLFLMKKGGFTEEQKAEYIRKRILTDFKVESKEEVELLRQLLIEMSRQGNNINQIASKVNMILQDDSTIIAIEILESIQIELDSIAKNNVELFNNYIKK